MSNTYQCKCGEWSGEPCNWSGPASDMVIVEWMPDQHRGSHDASGNSGIYPDNGSQRIVVERSCAELMIDTDGEWVRIVSEANATVRMPPEHRNPERGDEPMMTTTVHQLSHNGACWEHIPGASWSMPVPDGQTIAETLLANGPTGEWPDDDDERVCFRVADDCGDNLLDVDGDWRFVFTARELRAGQLDA